MIAIKLHITNIADYEFIHDKQYNYSGAFRLLYKHIGNLSKEMESFIKTKFNLNEIEFRSVREEVKTKFNQTQINKDKLIDEIIDLQDELKYLETQPRNKKNIRRIYKIINLCI